MEGTSPEDTLRKAAGRYRNGLATRLAVAALAVGVIAFGVEALREGYDLHAMLADPAPGASEVLPAHPFGAALEAAGPPLFASLARSEGSGLRVNVAFEREGRRVVSAKPVEFSATQAAAWRSGSREPVWVRVFAQAPDRAYSAVEITEAHWRYALVPGAFLAAALVLLLLAATRPLWPPKPHVPAPNAPARHLAARAALGLLGLFVLVMASAMFKGGLEDHARISHLKSQGVSLAARVVRVDQESQMGANPAGSNTESGTVHLATVRYEIDGVTIVPKRRLGIDAAQAAQFREHRPVTFDVLVLPEAPELPYRPETIRGDTLVALLGPFVLLAASFLLLGAATVGWNARPR